MSDRPCNYCDWQRIKREAKERKETAFIKYNQGWAEVFYKDNEGHERKGGCSFMELPNHCCC